MSVINQKPFINTVLESLSSEQIATLRGLINGIGAEPSFYSLLSYSSHLLKATDKGVKRAKIETGNMTQSLYNGYLIYTDDYCVLIAYSAAKNQELTLISIEKENGNWKYHIVDCDLTIAELRSELDDVAEAEGEMPNLTVSDIQALTSEECEQLKCGDIVIETNSNDGSKYTYVVTLAVSYAKALVRVSEGTITYVSYGKNNGTWSLSYSSETEIPDLYNVDVGELTEVLGYDDEGNLVKGAAGGSPDLIICENSYDGYMEFKTALESFASNDEEVQASIEGKHYHLNWMSGFRVEDLFVSLDPDAIKLFSNNAPLSSWGGEGFNLFINGVPVISTGAGSLGAVYGPDKEISICVEIDPDAGDEFVSVMGLPSQVYLDFYPFPNTDDGWYYE